LNDRTRRLLTKLMRSKQKTQSEIIREAIEALARSESAAGELSPYARVEDLIGCASGGPPDLSEDTGRKFTELLAARKRRAET
jgi:hypothetical protein